MDPLRNPRFPQRANQLPSNSQLPTPNPNFQFPISILNDRPATVRKWAFDFGD